MLRGNQWTVAPCATPSQVDLRDSHTWRKPRAEVLLLLFSSLDEERRELGLESSCTAKRCGGGGAQGGTAAQSPGTRVRGHSFSGSAGAWLPALPGPGDVSMSHLRDPLQS